MIPKIRSVIVEALKIFGNLLPNKGIWTESNFWIRPSPNHFLTLSFVVRHKYMAIIFVLYVLYEDWWSFINFYWDIFVFSVSGKVICHPQNSVRLWEEIQFLVITWWKKFCVKNWWIFQLSLMEEWLMERP